MTKRSKVIVIEKGGEGKMDFTEELWSDIMDHLAVTFNMDPDVKENMFTRETAKLIAAIPFLAGCRMPLRTAVIHAGLYYMAWNEGTRQYFYHREEDDCFLDSRLMPIAGFSEGDRRMIERGMNLLKLQMVAGYERDVDKDRNNNKYNPVASGRWDAVQLKKELIQAVEDVPCEKMDRIMNINTALYTWWSI